MRVAFLFCNYYSASVMEMRTSRKKKRDKLENPNALDLIIARPQKVKRDELYLFSCEVPSFHDIFVSPTKRNLRTVVVIGQSGITSLNGISRLENLRELWVVECRVEDLSDLRECRKLEILHLYSNNISRVPDASNSPELRLLSLSGNKISRLTNFHGMPKLKELYVANNRIKKIGDAFCQNSNLSLINLAGNPLHKLKDLWNLFPVSSLRSIVFVDPMHGECPLAYLCNYRRFVVYYLSGLTELDRYPITSEERSYVTGFFKSKMMFYNVLRNEHLNNFTKSSKDRRREINRRIDEYRREIYAAKLKQPRIAASCVDDPGSREFTSDDILPRIYRRIAADDACERRWIENSKIESEISQRQLRSKLEHCGNMNFVEYTPGARNTLVRICQDMCNDSLCRTVRRDLGITGVHVSRVTRVINNETDALRSFAYFNETMNEDGRESDCIFKLLVKPAGVAELRNWPFDVFEEEFFDATEIIIGDCLAAADADFMKRISLPKRSSPPTLCSSDEHRLAVLVRLPVSAPTTRIDKPDDYHATHPDYDEETCRCLSIANVEQAKPVFVVEYEYIFQNGFDEDVSERPLENSAGPGNSIDVRPRPNDEILPNCLRLTELEVHKMQVIDLFGCGIRTMDFTSPLPNLRELYLSYNKLSVLPDSVMLKYVRKLDVSFNDIESLKATASLPSMESLNVSWNRVVKFFTMLRTLESLAPNLIALNVEYNPFADVTGIESMNLMARNALPSLKYFNEYTIENVVRSRCVNSWWTIDIYENADAAKFEMTRKSTTSVISEANGSLTSPLSVVGREFQNVRYINLSDNRLSDVEFVKESPQLKELYLANNLLTKIIIERSLNKLTKLILRGNFITATDGLTRENLPSLNHLDLCDNLIASLTAMGPFDGLTEFYSSHNRIGKLSDIYNLKSWRGLQIIDLSNNPIHSTSLCDKFIVFHMPEIQYVNGERVTSSHISEANRTFGSSLDKDTITNVLNAGNDLTRIEHLSLVDSAMKKVDLTTDLLPNLRSLDLSRNEITTLWGLHGSNKLQVLCLSHNRVETSLPIHRKGQALAECSFPGLKTLYLDNNGIRSLVDFNLASMPSLKHLYLQRNQLQDLKGLRECAGLETLVLDHNEVEILTEEDFRTENVIQALFLENNGLRFLSFVRRLTKINKLFLSNNKLADKDQLKYLGELENLKEITILGNPLCKRTNHYKLALQTLPTLKRIDGHSTTLEEYPSGVRNRSSDR